MDLVFSCGHVPCPCLHKGGIYEHAHRSSALAPGVEQLESSVPLSCFLLERRAGQGWGPKELHIYIFHPPFVTDLA